MFVLRDLYSFIQSQVSHLSSTEFEAGCDFLKIPIGRIKKLDEVLSSSMAEEMILEESIDDVPTKRLRTVAFHIDRHP